MRELNQGLAWLNQYHSPEPRLGLERVFALLELVGNPHLKRPVIHIGGTNGKGSTLAFLLHMLMEKNFRVGVFSSPYMTSYEEQFSINKKPIDRKRLAQYIEKYQRIFSQEDKNSCIHGITEFELITVLAYDYFAQEEIDYILMEVGLGGLLDSTNVCQPILAGITTIGLDHVAILGNTLEEIAFQKAGIIKEASKLVTGNISPQALGVIEKVAQEKRVAYFKYKEDYKVEYLGRRGLEEEFYYRSQNIQGKFVSPLLGSHQVENAAMAIQLFEVLSQIDNLPYSIDLIDQALRKTKWPGRMEIMGKAPLILLDGAHNPHAIQRLVENMKSIFQGENISILFSCISTKDIQSMIRQMHDIPYKSFALTSFNHEKAYSKSQLLDLMEKDDIYIEEWKKYIRDFQREKGEEEVLLITGSLYFISQVRKFLLEEGESF